MQRGSSAAAECMKLPNGLCLLLVMSKKSSEEERGANLTSRISTYYQEKARIRPDGQTVREVCARLRWAKCRSWSFSCWEASPDVAGGRSCSRVGMWMERRRGGCGKEAGRVERNSLSLVRTLLRWNKPRLRNDIFSHPSNKLYIQQISGPLPNHFFPPQSLKSCIW